MMYLCNRICSSTHRKGIGTDNRLLFSSSKRENRNMETNIIHFTKMQGAGNDYIYVDTSRYPIADPHEVAIRLSRYHTGIGSDGLVLIGAPEHEADADFSMHIFNADGSEAMMCGNASRCIGKYLYEKRLSDKTEIRLETLSGVKTLKLHVEGGHVESVTVDMGMPKLQDEKQYNNVYEGILEADGRIFNGTFVSMGNPHFVCFVDDLATLDIAGYGSILEHSPAFPERCNIEFAQKQDDDTIRMRVWERGSGITMACGTGACATAVAASEKNISGRTSRICMDGGTLSIEWNEADGHVYMTGPAAFVFEGEVNVG